MTALQSAHAKIKLWREMDEAFAVAFAPERMMDELAGLLPDHAETHANIMAAYRSNDALAFLAVFKALPKRVRTKTGHALPIGLHNIADPRKMRTHRRRVPALSDAEIRALQASSDRSA